MSIVLVLDKWIVVMAATQLLFGQEIAQMLYKSWPLMALKMELTLKSAELLLAVINKE